MSDPEETRKSELETAGAALEEIVRGFEQAWRGGESPKAEDFLPPGNEPGAELLMELLYVELQFRLERGEAVRVEHLVQRFPTLSADKEQILGLISAEYELRKRHSPAVDILEFTKRFPQYRLDLEACLQPAPPHPHLKQPLRLNCPHCLNPMELNEAPGQEVTCSACGGAFQVAGGSTHSWEAERLPTLGKFELLEVVGRGAFGTVYRAHDTDLDRLVAVKIPRSGSLSSKLDEERFVREARNAAQLHHPGIVPVYEVGRSDTFPYIVSEYVQGVTLADAMTGRRFNCREAVEIVVEAAEALQHAHDHGVVHRDLKPSNIMLEQFDAAQADTVTISSAHATASSSKGGRAGSLDLRPRLMDFGLARRDDAEVTVTVEGQVLGTPAYMSPEQARGEGHAVDGRSDVYSLGVVMYELLAGELPFRGNVRMLLHQVLNNEPPPLRRFNDRIPRDLDTICIKCLQKEPSRRYPSASALAEDLLRYLQGRPITARPVGWVNRSWRWCRRKPALATLVGLLLMALLTGFSLVTWQWRRAERALDQAQKNSERLLDASDEMLAVFDQWLTRMPEEQPVRQQLLRRALQVYEQFLEEQPHDAQARRDVAAARHRVADIRRMLGQYDLAAEQYQQAIQGFQQLVAASPGAADLRRKLADSYNWLGESLRQGSHLDKAEAAYRQALQLQRELAAEHPTQVEYGGDLARSYYNLGLLMASAGRNAEAEQHYSESSNLIQRLLESNANDVSLQREAGRCHINLGNLLADKGDRPAANAQFLRAIDLLTKLAEQAPGEPEYGFELATVVMNRANLLYFDAHRGTLELGVAKPLEEAERLYREAGDRLRRLTDEYASIPKYRTRLANCYNGLSSLLIFADRLEDADRVLQDAQQQCQALVARYPDIAEARNVVGLVLYHQAQLARRMDDQQQAAELLRQAIVHQQQALASNPRNADYKTSLYAHRRLLATVSLELGDHAEAAKQAEQLLALAPQGALRAARYLAMCAQTAQADPSLDEPRRVELAEEYADQAVAFLRAAVARDACDADQLRRTKEFSLLEGRDDFQQIRRQLNP